jgi:hypothetical protein
MGRDFSGGIATLVRSDIPGRRTGFDVREFLPDQYDHPRESLISKPVSPAQTFGDCMNRIAE